MSDKPVVRRWDIWWADIPYEDNPEMSKVRPVVVADKGTYFYLTFKMTSHAPRPDFEGEYSVQYWKKQG